MIKVSFFFLFSNKVNFPGNENGEYTLFLIRVNSFNSWNPFFLLIRVTKFPQVVEPNIKINNLMGWNLSRVSVSPLTRLLKVRSTDNMVDTVYYCR